MSKLKVASWNIRKCVGLDWRRDPRRTARVLATLDADIVALQEVDKRLGHRPAALPRHLLETETPFRAVDVDGHEASLGWHGNALLVREGFSAHEDAHAFHLPGLEPRGGLVMPFGFGGVTCRIVAVHLGLLRQSRRQQYAAIRELAEDDPDVPTIVIGDFNEWSRRDRVSPVIGFNVHAPGPTFHAARPVAALDRIAVSDSLRVTSAHVVQTRDTRLASDHLPIAATLKHAD